MIKEEDLSNRGFEYLTTYYCMGMKKGWKMRFPPFSVALGHIRAAAWTAEFIPLRITALRAEFIPLRMKKGAF